jgi:hypothetical protein
MATKRTAEFVGLMNFGAWTGIAFGILFSVSMHDPSWLEQPDFLMRCVWLCTGTFACTFMAILSYRPYPWIPSWYSKEEKGDL